MYKKPVIIFEGIEGSGKTYHSNNLAKYLKKKKIEFRRGNAGGGNQMRQPYLKNIIK